MKLKLMLALFVAASVLSTSSAFALATFTCKQAKEFMSNPSYRCEKSSTDCSRGECVDIASCRFIKGFEGFTMTFSYPTDCCFDEVAGSGAESQN